MAQNQSMTYGGTMPTLTPFYTGFLNGDNPGNLTTADLPAKKWTVVKQL
jgi:hypothetical protein